MKRLTLALLGAALFAAPSFAAELPHDMQGKWCGELSETPGQRMYFECSKGATDLPSEIEVKGGKVQADEMTCIVLGTKPFNVYLVRTRVHVNAWGPGMAVTLQCRVEDEPRLRTFTEYWQIFKGGLVIDKSLPANAKQPSGRAR